MPARICTISFKTNPFACSPRERNHIRGVKLDAKKYGIVAESSGPGLGLSYIQIDAILELQLHRLTQLSVDEILKELAQIRARIAELLEILGSEKKLKAVIIAELREVLKAYGDERRTQIVDRVDDIKLEDLIKDVDMAITVSHAGYIKRTSVDVYRHQSRGGKGRIGAKTREEDFVEHFFVASAHSYILLFTSKGRVYWLKVYEIPEAAAATRGRPSIVSCVFRKARRSPQWSRRATSKKSGDTSSWRLARAP